MSNNKHSLVSLNGTSYLIPFILVTSLFFLWGFAHSLLDVLNKHFQEILGITKSKSDGFRQLCTVAMP
jgi:FHS family L-fucose permease-like MFS transporter